MDTILWMWLVLLFVLALFSFVVFRINWRGAKYDIEFERGLPPLEYEHECGAHYPRSWD